jgi:hypothetical protein
LFGDARAHTFQFASRAAGSPPRIETVSRGPDLRSAWWRGDFVRECDVGITSGGVIESRVC